MAYRAPIQNPPGAATASAAPGGAYGYDPGGYEYAPPAPQRPAMAVIWLIVAGVAIICLCCGLVIGGVISYAFFPTQSVPPTTPTPTPEGLNLFIQLFKV
jgi:hypothetical protein